MWVPVMHVVRMWVRVGDGLMAMPVSMGRLLQLPRPVLVLMMLIVFVLVGVFERFMGVFMNVDIGTQE